MTTACPGLMTRLQRPSRVSTGSGSNMARICLNATRTAARRHQVLRGMRLLAYDGERGCDDLRGCVWRMMLLALPTEDWSWVNPEVDPFTYEIQWVCQRGNLRTQRT